MDLASIISLVSSANADPSTHSEVNVDPQVTETVIGRNIPKPERKGSTKPSGAQAAPIHIGPQVFGVTMPDKGTLDAKGFVIAVRRAKDRNEVIQAIHAYCGYDTHRDFGSQDQEARAKAQRELRGPQATGPTREEERAASRSVAGYVAGMPHPHHRLVLDLQARERSLAESMIDAKTDQDRAQYAALLKQTREALAQLGF